jgi:hypothetical protein
MATSYQIASMPLEKSPMNQIVGIRELGLSIGMFKVKSPGIARRYCVGQSVILCVKHKEERVSKAVAPTEQLYASLTALMPVRVHIRSETL